ncbi:unnamed protein product [Ectocarpus sp. 4 AP-2014]
MTHRQTRTSRKAASQPVGGIRTRKQDEALVARKKQHRPRILNRNPPNAPRRIQNRRQISTPSAVSLASQNPPTSVSIPVTDVKKAPATRRTESTVGLLVARAGRGTAELLGLAAARVRDEQIPVVGHEQVLDLAFRGLVHVLLVERHDGLGDRLADGVDLGVRAGQKREGRGPRCST